MNQYCALCKNTNNGEHYFFRERPIKTDFCCLQCRREYEQPSRGKKSESAVRNHLYSLTRDDGKERLVDKRIETKNEYQKQQLEALKKDLAGYFAADYEDVIL